MIEWAGTLGLLAGLAWATHHLLTVTAHRPDPWRLAWRDWDRADD